MSNDEDSSDVSDFGINNFDIAEEELIFEYKDGVYNNKGKAFAIEEQDRIRLKEKYKDEGKDRTRRGFSLYSKLHVDKLFNSLRSLADTLGWDIETTEDVEELKEKVQAQAQTIENLEEVKRKHENDLKRLKREKWQKYIERIEKFEDNIEELREKIDKAKEGEIKEKKLQKFLEERPWFFGYQYVDSEPQKEASSLSQFDFYLERYNGTEDIFEIKKISDEVLTSKGDIRSDVIQAIDQCIEYIWHTKDISRTNDVSREAQINEVRPRGRIIIGYDVSEKARRKLDKWNYQLNNIEVITYGELLERAEKSIENIRGELN